jgi:hypothetical protein
MSNIDYYSKYKKYKRKYILLQYGGDDTLKNTLNQIIEKLELEKNSKQFLIELLKKNDKEKKIYKLLIALQPLSDENKIKVELKNQINVIKELIGKFIDKLPIDPLSKTGLRASLKLVYTAAKVNMDLIIIPLKPIIDILLNAFKHLKPEELEELKKK